MKFLFKRKVAIIILVLLLLTIGIPVFSYASDTVTKIDRIVPDNVYIDEINIGGITLPEAEEIIDKKISDLENKEIEISFNDSGQTQTHYFTLKELGYFSNKNVVKSEIADMFNNDLGIIEKIKNYRAIERNGKIFKVTEGIEFDKFSSMLKVFEKQNMYKPVNAKFKYQDGQILIVDGKSGYDLDIKGLYDEISQKLNESQDEFALSVKEVKPEITTEELEKQGIKEKVASFTTTFTSSNKPRSKNISLAGRIIDGTIVAPGETFSFNNAVGKRTKERGFQEAGVYVNGRVDTGIGGGICQVSTTLFNAALLADLEIVERRNHSLTVPYVPLSRDAAVSWGTQDFEFRNNTNYYIYIHTKLTENTITFDLFSTKNNKTVELISTTLEHKEAPVEYKDDKNLETGKEVVVDKGHDGYRSILVKKVYVDGKLIDEQTIANNDKYLTSTKVVRRGVK